MRLAEKHLPHGFFKAAVSDLNLLRLLLAGLMADLLHYVNFKVEANTLCKLESCVRRIM